ncbi:DUF2971 domain-containing protein [Bacteroides graminisolvens]|uniref:DUF2971 domain-containing protein n=1 Tax=Bacteroides graminisolvens TaxID=477666 RepID=UPI0029C89855|nr:DUF2971 domain-containing protein [Bacteroides graminisolvens]
MTKAYKYRANLIVDGKTRDTEQLLGDVFYAANLRVLNDPFEGSVELPTSNAHEHWVTPLIQAVYDVGIYSLSKPEEHETFPNNELLWAHYSNSHKGFCIEYDLDILTENLSRDFDLSDKINVSYEDERPEVSETDSLLQVRKKVFGTKSLAWKYENEVRLVFSKGGLKPVSEKAISAIYFGLNISLEDRRAIITGMPGRNIDFYQVERIENSYKLKVTKLLFDYSYEIVNVEHRPTVDNYMILYKSPNKDENTMQEFIEIFRRKLNRPTNITVIDDIRAKSILMNYKPRPLMSNEEINIQAKHWIAHSLFDAPECVWVYPEK